MRGTLRFLPGVLVLVLAWAVHSAPSRGLEPLVRVLRGSDDVEVQRDVLRGMLEALAGRRRVEAPPGWNEASSKLLASSSAEVRQKTLLLSVLFGDEKALASLRRTVTDAGAEAETRRSALQTLVEARAPELLGLLRGLLDDRDLRRAAIQGLATVRDPETPALLLQRYGNLSEAERADVLATLGSRIEFARALMDAVEAGKVPSKDLSPFLVRQMMSLNDGKLRDKIGTVWGTVRPANLTQLPRYLSVVPPDALKKAERSQGRALFVKHCASCHALFNEGGRIGPELTGSQRTNPEYLLTKLLAPSAVVARDYLMTTVTTSDGRSVSGLVKEENDKVLLLQTATQQVRIAKSDIEERSRSNQSLMPDGLLQTLSDREVRDLIGYLSGPDQVPLP
jgi:putative heme-binding domain-containing protein